MRVAGLTKTDTGSDTSVETLETVGLVDVVEGVEDSLFSGSIGVHGLDGGLHLLISFILFVSHQTDLDSDDLNGLVPCSQSTTDGTGQDLVEGT